MIKVNVRKLVHIVDVEKSTSLPKERELELMKEIKILTKRIRKLEVPLEEKKLSDQDTLEIRGTRSNFFVWKAQTYCKELFQQKK